MAETMIYRQLRKDYSAWMAQTSEELYEMEMVSTGCSILFLETNTGRHQIRACNRQIEL